MAISRIPPEKRLQPTLTSRTGNPRIDARTAQLARMRAAYRVGPSEIPRRDRSIRREIYTNALPRVTRALSSKMENLKTTLDQNKSVQNKLKDLIELRGKFTVKPVEGSTNFNEQNALRWISDPKAFLDKLLAQPGLGGHAKYWLEKLKEGNYNLTIEHVRELMYSVTGVDRPITLKFSDGRELKVNGMAKPGAEIIGNQGAFMNLLNKMREEAMYPEGIRDPELGKKLLNLRDGIATDLDKMLGRTDWRTNPPKDGPLKTIYEVWKRIEDTARGIDAQTGGQHIRNSPGLAGSFFLLWSSDGNNQHPFTFTVVDANGNTTQRTFPLKASDTNANLNSLNRGTANMEALNDEGKMELKDQLFKLEQCFSMFSTVIKQDHEAIMSSTKNINR